MSSDPFVLFRATDTIDTIMMVQALTVPPELKSIYPATVWKSDRCISKTPGTLSLTLNSIEDLGIPAPMDFEVTFNGNAMPNPPGPAIEFTVNDTVRKSFKLPSGVALTIESVTGKVVPKLTVRSKPLSSFSCSGAPRLFELTYWAARAFGDVVPGVDLTVEMSIEGQRRELTLSLNAFIGQCGQPPQTFRGPSRPIEAIWWELIFQFIPAPVSSQQSIRDVILGLAMAQMAGASHDRASMRKLQQSALETASAALSKLRSDLEKE
jgi:hypothetical protein